MAPPQKYAGFVVSHTHWDREWYLSFQEFRVRLVRLVDRLLQVCRTVPKFRSFMLDGQTLPLEDYLAIRPQHEAELAEFIQAGRIVVGPFYVLADEFLESAEGIVRNLLIGHQIARKFGAVMKVGYVPDTFGHVWQLPQILAGCDIPYSYLFRGYPPLFGNHVENARVNADFPLEHYWAAPDGSRVLNLHHITGYGNAGHLCEHDPQQAALFPELRFMGGISAILMATARLRPRTTTRHLLFMNGGDHQEPEAELPEFLEAWNANEEIKAEENLDLELRHARLEEFFEAVAAAGPADGDAFPTLTGEMRGSAYTQVTPACLSTRMSLKQANFQCAQALERYAEPLNALAYFYLGQPYPAGLLLEAWKWLLKNHPHDSICGCSLDRVHEDMGTRFNWALDIAYQVAERALTHLARAVVAPDVHTRASSHDVVLTAWNLTPHAGRQLVSGLVTRKGSDALVLVDAEGREVPSAIVTPVEDYRDMPGAQYLYKKFQRSWRVARVTFVDDLPAFGCRRYLLTGRPASGPETSAALPGGVSPVTLSGTTLENGLVRVSVNPDGSVDVQDLETGHVYPGCHVFEDAADDGDEYDYAPLPGVTPLTSTDLVARVEPIVDSPLTGTIKLTVAFPVPEALEGDWRQGETRARGPETVTIAIETTVSLSAGSKRVEFVTWLTNSARDHRLRVLFPTGLPATAAHADEHFMVQRRPIALPEDEGWFQPAQGLYHQDAFVDVHDPAARVGLAVLNRGLPEYEVLEEQATIALTLFRAVGWLSKGGHAGRPSGLNGPALPTPGAQCLQPFQFEYALYPHAGDWTNEGLQRAVASYIAPAVLHEVEPSAPPRQRYPAGTGFLEVANPLVRVSALKKAEDHEGLVLRAYNPSDAAQETAVHFGKPVRLTRVNLLEETVSNADGITIAVHRRADDANDIDDADARAWRLTLPPYKIVSLLVERA